MTPDPRVAAWLRSGPVAVVGGYGLLGSALLERLTALGASPIAVEPSPRSFPGVEHRKGDVRDPESLRHSFAGCSAVIHLAALKSAGDSASAPLDYFAVNSQGTANVLEACRLQSVRSIVYASTSHVYGIPKTLPVPEDHPTLPLSIYAASKLSGETATLAYSATYRLDARVVRMANLYGGRPDRETVVGRAVFQAASGGPISLRSLDSIRDFLHLADAAEGLIRIAAAPAPEALIVNLSDGRGISGRTLADRVATAAQEVGLPRPEIVEPDSPAPDPVPNLVLANDRLRSLTGWTPGTDLGTGLRDLLKATVEGKRAGA